MAASSLVAALLIALAPGPASAAAPDSPEVLAMVDKALAWLETQSDDRLGGKCLIGLSFFKAGRDAKHPKITAAQAACETGLSGQGLEGIDRNYSLGLALIFLLETNPVKNRNLAARYVEEILKRQQSAGGWGYDGKTEGDTSQTQYPTLGLWLAKNHDVNVPAAAIEKTCGWLLRTQAPNGAWGYQGQDPGNFNQRVEQMEIRPALAAAGLGSLYICADALRIGANNQSAAEGQLPALKPVAKEEEKSPVGTRPAIDPKLIRRAMSDGDSWFDRNYTLESENFTHYYLYALERYHSFRELATRKVDPSPKWYNDIVALLKKTQLGAGNWEGADTSTIATSFSVLVLLRSARKTIVQTAAATDLGKGVLLGGLGLPANTADLKEQNGKLVESPLVGGLDDLLTMIEDPKNADLDRLAESNTALALDNDVVKRSGQIVRLRAIVSGGSFESRLIAVRAIARVRDLDNVPLLIYALTDPDPRIVREADKGLRFVSRKFDGFGMPAEPKPAEVQAIAASWKEWFRSIRPNAEFLD